MIRTSPRYFGRSSKFQNLCTKLYELATHLGPNEKLPTIVQLRDSMNVSMATLNLALKELESQNIIYRKHGVGIYVSPQLDRKSICLICESAFMQTANHSPFWDILMEQAQARAVNYKENFELHFTQPKGTFNGPLLRGLSNDMESGHVDGVIGVGIGRGLGEWIQSQDVAYVSIFGPGQYKLYLDNQRLIQLGVEQLRESGCKRLGLWMPVPSNRPRVEETEWNGATGSQFLVSVENSGLIPYPELVQLNHHLLPNIGDITLQSHQEQGFHLATKVFSRPRSEWPDGILITDDMMTYGAFIAMQKMGVVFGRDVQAISHANRGSSVLIGLETQLTLLEYDPAEIVHQAFHMLECLMIGQVPEQESVLVQPRLRKISN
jgi:DNA-binding LacI/PurR family transcriptional regulator